MSENTLPTAFATRQAAAIAGRSRRGAVTGKLREALDLMVWSGEKRDDAAKKAGLADCSLRAALRKPHVLAHYRAECAALRESVRPRNFHRLDKIADDSKNDMARVAAVKAMENIADQDDDKRRGPGAVTLPGLQIVIIGNPNKPPVTIGPAPFPRAAGHPADCRPRAARIAGHQRAIMRRRTRQARQSTSGRSSNATGCDVDPITTNRHERRYSPRNTGSSVLRQEGKWLFGRV